MRFNGRASFWRPGKKKYTFFEASNNAYQNESDSPSKKNVRIANRYRFRSKYVQWRIETSKDFLRRNIGYATFIVAVISLVYNIHK